MTTNTHLKIQEVRAYGLRGQTPEGGWSNELQPEDCVHTIIAVLTSDGIGWGSVFTSEALVKASLEILRPLVGMDKDEITAEARAIGTLPILNIPDQDCCTLFTPRNPLTRGRLAHVEAAERALAIEEIVDKAAADAVVEDFQFPASAAGYGGARRSGRVAS